MYSNPGLAARYDQGYHCLVEWALAPGFNLRN